MSQLDLLPPDQRAVLSLVLNQGRSYGEVAGMLGISEETVRKRAHAALDTLAGHTPPGPMPPSQSQGHGPRLAITPRGSRLGGALLLGGIVAAIIVAVILLSSGGNKGSSSNASSPTATSTSSTSTSGANGPTVDKRIPLTAAQAGSKANGLGFVLSQNGRHAFYVAAQGLAPSSGFFYAVWLYNSGSSAAPLGRAPTVSSNGRLEGGGPLPSNAGSYRKLIVTRETNTHPTQPGPIVLSGEFALH